MKLSVTRQSIARCLKIILGNFLITGAYSFITVPNEIVNGGFTSFSMILGNLLSIDLTYLVDFFTILLLILCYIFLGKKIFHRNRIQLFLLSHPVFRPARSGICNPGSSGHRHGSGRIPCRHRILFLHQFRIHCCRL